ncbi:MAG TPA: anhydro-N-acetylmuramic acid kinase [Methylophaga sp.]|nr:anhydro-N-acetylmuramic acid kinase [Methylophaga sp.]
MALFIGVISGTSVDGIDTALLDIEANQPSRLLAAKTFAYPVTIRSAIHQLIKQPQVSLQALGELDMALGRVYADAIMNLLHMADIQPSKISAIGCHGQTIYHAPYAKHPFSMQIGNANLIAELTGISTVADMRQRDMVCGGQGAPMVPGFHEKMFYDETENRVIVNIGGIANITVLPADKTKAILGFDTGPGNTLMDAWIENQLGKAFDANGDWAASGTSDAELLENLLDEAYFSLPVPKSSGRELFHFDWLQQRLARYEQSYSAEDVQATLLKLTARTIAESIHQYAPDCQRAIICGGGAHNDHLMQALQDYLPSVVVDKSDQHGMDVDFVEASAFAWLASRTLNRQSGSIPSVTGAQRPSILGGIYWSQ